MSLAVLASGRYEKSGEIEKGDGAECAGFVIWKLAMIRTSRFSPHDQDVPVFPPVFRDSVFRDWLTMQGTMKAAP